MIGVATARRFILEARCDRMRPHYDLTLTLAAIVGLCGYGYPLMQVQPAGRTALRVALVQPNVPRDQKFNSASA